MKILMEKLRWGLGNNLFQLQNILDFISYYNLDINDFKVLCKIPEDRSFIFSKYKDIYLETIQISKRITFNDYKSKNIKLLDYCNYIINPTLIGLKEDNVYNFLNIKEKQDYLLNKYNFDNDCTCIHIRRKDFLRSFPQYVLSDDKIINIIEENYDSKICICTDDINYCIKLLKKYNIFYIKKLNLKMDEELILASTCKKIIKNPGSTWSCCMQNFSSNYWKNK